MKLLVVYHVRFSFPDRNFALGLFVDQMKHLRECGLWDKAEVLIGFNEDQVSAEVREHIRGADTVCHGIYGRSEATTIHWLWTQLHRGMPDDYYVCYFHAKGVTHPGDRLCHVWRMCMENVVLGQWQSCVQDLNMGFDMAGSHWLTPQRYGASIRGHGMWGGNFWWARAVYLKTLAPIIANSTNRDEDFLAERWTGTGRVPTVHDYRPHWPNEKDCSG